MTPQKKLLSATIVATLLMGLTVPLAYGQDAGSEPIPDDLPIEINTGHGLIIIIGALGGLTSAYLGSRKAKSQDPKYKFNIHRFLDRVIVSIIASVGLAISAATGYLELNLVTMFWIFLASLGTAQLVAEVRNRNTGPAS